MWDEDEEVNVAASATDNHIVPEIAATSDNKVDEAEQ